MQGPQIEFCIAPHKCLELALITSPNECQGTPVRSASLVSKFWYKNQNK